MRTMKRTPTTSLATLLAAATLTAAQMPASAAPAGRGDDGRGHVKKNDYTTTKGMPSPLVVAHRGASGYRPEHTLAAYELAVAMGADYIEPDLVSTKDGVLVDRHENEISGTTDVAKRSEFASRKKTVKVDGAEMTGWFTEDFTLAELKTLRAKERLPFRDASAVYNGLYQVPTYSEVLALREKLSKQYGRTIGIIPEIKHSTYFQKIGLPMEAKVVKETAKFGLNHSKAPMWVQSFELTNLLELKGKHGYKANTTFLTTAKDAPYDLVAKGDKRTYADLLTNDSLKKLASGRTAIDGLGPEKAQIIPRNADGTLGTPTDLVDRAHKAGLEVIPWTFRNENSFLPVDYRIGTDEGDHGRAIDEIVVYLKTGIDGFFTDQPDTGVVARDLFWGKLDRK